MADIIRYISSFSDDAVHNAIQQAFGAEKQCFIDMLARVQSQLEKPPKRMKKASRMFRRSDKTIFEQKVLPQIREKLAEYDRLETVGNQLEWKVRLEFVGDYQSLNMDQLKQRHAMILEEEKSLACFDLIVKYYRGLVYFRARELVDKNENIKAAFRAEFGVCYDTVCRYITFAALLKRYPRLMICGLSYAQITKHQKRLLDYLKSETELHDQLSQPISVSAQEKAVEIQSADMEVPKISFSTDPDYLVYGDYFYDPAWDDIPEDSEFDRWLQECDSSAIFSMLYDSDHETTNEIQHELGNVNIE